MVAAPSATADDMHRNQNSSGDGSVLANRDRQMEWPTAQNGCPPWNGQGWSTTPPFPTPALTASSLSSSSLFGERSPVLGPSKAATFPRRNFDFPHMTSLSHGRSHDDVPAMALSDKCDGAGGEQPPNCNGIPSPLSHYEGTMASLSSSLGGLTMYDHQAWDSTRSCDAASLRKASSFVDPRQSTPLLIPMQPTGAGVPLTSVVETLSSKGSKAAAEDPETVAAAYKLSQWGIGYVTAPACYFLSPSSRFSPLTS